MKINLSTYKTFLSKKYFLLELVRIDVITTNFYNFQIMSLFLLAFPTMSPCLLEITGLLADSVCFTSYDLRTSEVKGGFNSDFFCQANGLGATSSGLWLMLWNYIYDRGKGGGGFIHSKYKRFTQIWFQVNESYPKKWVRYGKFTQALKVSPQSYLWDWLNLCLMLERGQAGQFLALC